MKVFLYIIWGVSFIQIVLAQDCDSLKDMIFFEKAEHGIYQYQKKGINMYVDKQQSPDYKEDFVLNEQYFKELHEFEQTHRTLLQPYRPTFYMQRMGICIQSIIRNIRPYVKHTGEGSFFMRIILDGSGKIKNIHFQYPSYLSIPAVALERLTMDMEKHCYATFKMHEILEGADNIPFYLSFDIDAIFYDTIDENATYTYTP